MGNITIQGDLTGDVPGGEVGGASNLTTVGAIPYVSAAGILNQDSTALFWDAANNRLGVGTASPSAQVESYVSSGNTVNLRASNGGNASGDFAVLDFVQAGVQKAVIYTNTNNMIWNASGGALDIKAASSLAFFTNNTDRARFAATTGNFLIGTTTDSNFKLDVAASGSVGTARFYGGAGVSDTTKVVVRAGGGQGTSALVSIQDGAASEVARLTDNVNSPFRTYSAGTLKAWFGQNAFMSNSAGVVGWTPTGDANASPDLSLSRAAAGVLQVGDGGSNANGKVRAAEFTLSGALSQFSVSRRDNSNPAFSIYSGSGNLQFYDNGIDADTLTLATGGTMTLYNSKATTGVTKAVIRAGAGQSTTSLTEWQNSAGTTLASVSATGALFGSVLYVGTGADGEWGPSALKLKSNQLLGWVNGSNATGTADTALARNAAGVLEVNNGTAGTYRDILARRHQASGETVASLPAAAAGNAGTISYVTDANATTIGSTVAGGGANKVLVWSNGTAWKIFAN